MVRRLVVLYSYICIQQQDGEFAVALLFLYSNVASNTEMMRYSISSCCFEYGNSIHSSTDVDLINLCLVFRRGSNVYLNRSFLLIH
jgi:hypothetical protein